MQNNRLADLLVLLFLELLECALSIILDRMTLSLVYILRRACEGLGHITVSCLEFEVCCIRGWRG